MSSKIDHKEMQRRLKEDEVQVYAQELVQNGRRFLDEYGAKIGIGILVVVGIIAAYYFWQMQQQSAFATQQSYFANAMAWVQMEEPQYAEAVAELDSLIQQFPGAGVTQLAYLQRGHANFKLENYEQALADYQTAARTLPDEEQIAAQLGIIQTYRSLGQPENALSMIGELETSLKSDAMLNKITYLKAGVYEDMGDDAQALETYRSIDPDSTWYSLAQDKIRWLEADAVSAIN